MLPPLCLSTGRGQDIRETCAVKISVLEHGAAGDGVTADTQAIQKAFDACSKTGGVVEFPAGRYLTGSLFLRQGVNIHLHRGARLLGSTAPEDYSQAPSDSERGPFPGIGALIHGYGLEGVTIEGEGTIDGQGRAFWTGERLARNVRKPKALRPHAMIHLVKCNRVCLNRVRLINSPCYTAWLMGCEDVDITGVTIDNPLDGPNTDGLDIDCCRRVRITDFTCSAGDDCIAVKSDITRLGEMASCEEVFVSDCVLRSTACAVRIGYEGDGPIRNCRFRNLAISDTDIGIDIVSVLPANQDTGVRHGAVIEGVFFESVSMRNTVRPLFIWLGNETGGFFRGAIRNITIRDVSAEVRSAGFVGGMPGHRIEDVSLNNIRLEFVGQDSPGAVESDPDVWGARTQPYGLIFRRVRGLRVNDLVMDWRRATGHQLGEMEMTGVEEVETAGIVSVGFDKVACGSEGDES